MGLVCTVCGGTEFQQREILWQGLIDEWQLSRPEAAYVNRQQGMDCSACGANLRSIALARAMRAVLNFPGSLLDYVGTPASAAVTVLELNEAGSLSPTLRRLPGHTFGAYPEVDMHALPYADETFDIVVHSDTLEHVPNPTHGLSECRRVLKPGGALCYTVPVIIGRLSRAREGLPKSYHGNPAESGDDFVVQTEFGADFWCYPIQAGFSEIRIFPVDFPSATAIAAFR